MDAGICNIERKCFQWIIAFQEFTHNASALRRLYGKGFQPPGGSNSHNKQRKSTDLCRLQPAEASCCLQGPVKSSERRRRVSLMRTADICFGLICESRASDRGTSQNPPGQRGTALRVQTRQEDFDPSAGYTCHPVPAVSAI